MGTIAVVLFEARLSDASDEALFLRWWEEARRLLTARHRAIQVDLHVLGRGHYLAVGAFSFPGAATRVVRDPRWRELLGRSPRADIRVREARTWRFEGAQRDVSTAELAHMLEERAAGRRDFVLLDVLPSEGFAQRRLPGAVNLPLGEIDLDRATEVIGPRDRAVVVYCSGST